MTALHGFEQTRQRRIDELDAVLHEYTHAASGARLCWLEREDENKSFCAAFRTLPYDDTGVFHILEHSVLCGSKQFPVKEPFVELMKGSLNTFLNALTFPDKTCYPVASRNSRDFLNLMRVYLDAVFFPSIHEKPEIFQQEGWHYEPLRVRPVCHPAPSRWCRDGRSWQDDTLMSSWHDDAVTENLDVF